MKDLNVWGEERQTSIQFSSVQFSSVQFKMVYVHSQKSICAPSRLSEIFADGAFDDGPLSSFQGRSSSASFFHASLLQAIDGVMSVALCPQVVSQAPQHCRFSEKASQLWGLLCPPVYLLGRFPSLRQASTPRGVFEGGCRPLTHSSPGFLFHFSLFVTSSLNL